MHCILIYQKTLVFLTLRLSLFSVNHSAAYDKSLFTLSFNESLHFSLNNSVVSSANIMASENLRHFLKSLIYSKNSNGPRVEPWGTPQRTVSNWDISPLTTVNCWRSVRYDDNHCRAVPLIPSEDRRLMSMVMSMYIFNQP